MSLNSFFTRPVRKGDIEIKYLHTDSIPADLLTKTQIGVKYSNFATILLNGKTSEEGSISGHAVL